MLGDEVVQVVPIQGFGAKQVYLCKPWFETNMSSKQALCLGTEIPFLHFIYDNRDANQEQAGPLK